MQTSEFQSTDTKLIMKLTITKNGVESVRVIKIARSSDDNDIFIITNDNSEYIIDLIMDRLNTMRYIGMIIKGADKGGFITVQLCALMPNQVIIEIKESEITLLGNNKFHYEKVLDTFNFIQRPINIKIKLAEPGEIV